MRLEHRWLSPRVIFGIFIILLGLAFTLDNFGVPLGASLREGLGKGWPVVFVVVGLARLAESRDLGGFVWLTVGSAFLAHNFGLVELRRVWPLGLVMGGVFLVFRAFVPPCAPRREAGDRLDALAFMGGTRRSLTSSGFEGGSLVAVMGGVEVDLRGATIPPGAQATIDTFAVWGGIEITVPRGWEVHSRGVPLLGAFEDSTERGTEATESGPRPRLVVTGVAIMGGVEVKN